MVALALPATPSPQDRQAAEERRGRLLAALLTKGMKGADLHRLLGAVGEKTSPTTVSNWCRGEALLTEIQIRGLLSVIGLDPGWQPDADLLKQALEEQRARQRVAPEERAKPRRARH